MRELPELDPHGDQWVARLRKDHERHMGIPREWFSHNPDDNRNRRRHGYDHSCARNGANRIRKRAYEKIELEKG